jgi:hypothetical protein
MSHVGNGEHDFDGLESLDQETAKKIKAARIEARYIMDAIEPAHIRSLSDLFAKLDNARRSAEENAKMFDPEFAKRCQNEVSGQSILSLSRRTKLVISLLLVGWILILYLTNNMGVAVSSPCNLLFWFLIPICIAGFSWVICLPKLKPL